MNTQHRIITTAAVALALALGAGAAPAPALIYTHGSNGSQLNSPSSPAPCGDVCSGHGYGSVSPQPTIVHASSPDGGFDWGDAGIGAAGGIALSILGLGGALAVSQRRARPSKSATA